MSKEKLISTVGEKTIKEDKRNLGLTNEGLLNTKDFKEEGRVSELDMKARIRLSKSKREALKKNPNLFISKTRICVRNLPKKFVEADFKTLIEHYLEQWKNSLTFEFRAAHNLKTKKIIHQIKLLRDTEQLEDGKPSSKGMGFAEVEHAEAALYIVRYMNNLNVN
jgi:nucleolar protein 4